MSKKRKFSPECKSQVVLQLLSGERSMADCQRRAFQQRTEKIGTNVAEAGICYEPDPAAHDVYNRVFQLYLRLYPPLIPFFKDVVDLDLLQGWIK